MMRRLSHAPYTYKDGWRSGDVCNLRTRIILVRIADHKKKEQSQKHAKKIAVFLAKLPLFVVLVIIVAVAVAVVVSPPSCIFIGIAISYCVCGYANGHKN